MFRMRARSLRRSARVHRPAHRRDGPRRPAFDLPAIVPRAGQRAIESSARASPPGSRSAPPARDLPYPGRIADTSAAPARDGHSRGRPGPRSRPARRDGRRTGSVRSRADAGSSVPGAARRPPEHHGSRPLRAVRCSTRQKPDPDPRRAQLRAALADPAPQIARPPPASKSPDAAPAPVRHASASPNRPSEAARRGPPPAQRRRTCRSTRIPGLPRSSPPAVAAVVHDRALRSLVQRPHAHAPCPPLFGPARAVRSAAQDKACPATTSSTCSHSAANAAFSRPSSSR